MIEARGVGRGNQESERLYMPHYFIIGELTLSGIYVNDNIIYLLSYSYSILYSVWQARIHADDFVQFWSIWTLEKNHSHTNVKHQIWRQGHRAQSYKLVGSHSRQRWTMNTLVTTQRINFLISGHPEIFETSTTKHYNLQITKLKIYLIVYHHMKLKSKTDKRINE